MAIDKLSANAFATGAIANSLGYTPLGNTSGSITSTLGYTPANKAGDTFTGNTVITGTLGIGNATPGTYLLSIGDGSSNRGRIYMKGATGGAYPEINMDDTGNSGKNYQLISSANNWFINDQTGGGLTRFFLSSNGNIGVGTTAPSKLLELNGTSGVVRTGTDAYFYIQETSATNYAQALVLADSSQSWFVVNRYGGLAGASGFGIGTSNAGDMLQIDTSGHWYLGTAGAVVKNSSGRPILQQSGSVLQVVSASKTDAQSFAPSTSFSDITGLSVSITPTSTSSKILVFFQVNGGVGAGDSGHLHIQLNRNGSAIGIADAASNKTRGSAAPINTSQGGQQLTSCNMYFDSPGTTSAVTYKLQMKANEVGATGYVNRSNRDNDGTGYDGRGVSNITVMEIAQ